DETVHRPGTRCETCAHYNKLAKQQKRRNSPPNPLVEAVSEAVEELEQTVKTSDGDLVVLEELDPVERLKDIQQRLAENKQMRREDMQYAAHYARQIQHILNETNEQNHETLRELQLWAERYNPSNSE